MQVTQEQEVGQAARRSGRGSGVATATVVDGRAEFKEMFVSLVDPAGLLDMDRCGRTAGLMADSASRSGYQAGARMASLLAGIFADMSDIVNRPVEDGALGCTQNGFRHMIGVLYDTARAYRGGGDAEPVDELEEARAAIAKLRIKADARRERVRAAGPPGAGLSGLDRCYMGRLCRDVVRKAQEGVRERAKARGHDPIFLPEPKPIEFPDDGLNLSGLQTMQLMEGNIPDGYELVKVEELDELRRQAGRASDSGAVAGMPAPGNMQHRGGQGAREGEGTRSHIPAGAKADRVSGPRRPQPVGALDDSADEGQHSQRVRDGQS